MKKTMKSNSNQFINIFGGGGEASLLFNIFNKMLLFILFISLSACSSDTTEQELKDASIIQHFFKDANTSVTSDPAHKSTDNTNLLFIHSMEKMDLYSNTFSENISQHSIEKERPNIIENNNPFYKSITPGIILQFSSKKRTFHEKVTIAFPKSFIDALKNKNHLAKAPQLITYLTPTSYNFLNKNNFTFSQAKKLKNSYQYTITVKTSNDQVYTSQTVVVYLGNPLPYTSFKNLLDKETFTYKNSALRSRTQKIKYPSIHFDAYEGNPLAAFIRLNEDKKSTFTVTIHNKENPKGDISYKRSLKKGALEILGLYYNDITKVTLQKNLEKPKTLFFDTRDYKPDSVSKKILKKYEEQKSVKLTEETDYQKLFMIDSQISGEKHKAYGILGVDVHGKIRFFYPRASRGYKAFLIRLFKKNQKMVLESGKVLHLNGAENIFQNDYFRLIHHDIIHIPEKHSYVLTLLNGDSQSDILKLKDDMSLSYYKRDSMNSILPKKLFTPKVYAPYYDFYHLNSLSYNKCNNLLALSTRNQSTVAFVDYDTLKLKYFLADKRNINPDYYKYLLKNTGNNKDILSRQHAIQFINCHQLILFNNGVTRHLRNPKTKNYSSIDLYDIDFKNHSFKLSKQWKSKTYSSVVSYVDYDPRTEQFFMQEGYTSHVKTFRMLDKDLKKIVWNLKLTETNPSHIKEDYFKRIYRAFPFNLK